MAREYANKGFVFLFLYTREAHPGENFPAHRNIEQKLAHARAFKDRLQIERPILVDDLVGTAHKLYGMLPNMTYIIGRGGKISFGRTGQTRRRSNGRFDTSKIPARADGKAFTSPRSMRRSSVIAGTLLLR